LLSLISSVRISFPFCPLSDLTPSSSQLFDSWFGYILWAFAYFEIYRHNENRGRWAKVEYGFNIRKLASALRVRRRH